MDLTPYLDAAWREEVQRDLANAKRWHAASPTWGASIANCELLLAENDADILAAAKRLREAERQHFHAYDRNREAAEIAWARDQEDAA